MKYLLKILIFYIFIFLVSCNIRINFYDSYNLVAPKIVSPKDNDSISTKIKWEKIEGVSIYRIRINNSDYMYLNENSFFKPTMLIPNSYNKIEVQCLYGDKWSKTSTINVYLTN